MDEDFRTDTASSPPIIVPPRALTIDAACEGGAGGSGGGGGAGGTGSSSSAKRKARRDDKLVRTESDNPSGRLDAYLRRANSAPTASGSSSLSSAHSGIKVQAATLQLRRQQEEADSLDTSAEPTEAKAQSTLSGYVLVSASDAIDSCCGFFIWPSVRNSLDTQTARTSKGASETNRFR